jgi:peptide deformylase
MENERPITRIIAVPPYVGMIDGKFLGRPSEKVTKLTEEIVRDANGMAHALIHSYKTGFSNNRRGFALAHAQVNMRPWAFFVAFADVNALNEGTFERMGAKTFVNPEIVEFGGRKRQKDELCLSFPFHPKARVDRWEKVRVRWQEFEKKKDGNFKLSEVKEEWIEGLFAQVWQHEMEHLLGGTIYGAPMW